jgi:hypothetical protein
MLRSTRSRVTALVAAGCLSAGIAGTAAAAPQQNGLINVNATDINVQAPISVAAVLCNTNVNVLAEQLNAGNNNCAGNAESTATNWSGPSGGSPKQDGLVNVNITDVNAQVPISVAATICDTNVNVLARQLALGDTTCRADAVSLARN